MGLYELAGQILPWFQIARGEVGTAEANRLNQQQYDIGAGILGYDPETGQPTQRGGMYGELDRRMASDLQSSLGDLARFRGSVYDVNQSIFDDTQDQLRRVGAGYGTMRDRLGEGYGDLGGSLAAGYGQLGGMAGTQGQGILDQLREGYGGLERGFGTRESDVMGLLQGMGNTERYDINESFNNLSAANQANLRSRGMGSSTITGGQATADQRARTRELGGLEERLRTQQAGVLSGLRGEQLAAQERGVGASAAQGNANLGLLTELGLAGLGSSERVGTSGLAADERATQNWLSESERATGVLTDLARERASIDRSLRAAGLTAAAEGRDRRTSLVGQQGGAQLGWLQQLQHEAPNLDAAYGNAINFFAAMNAPVPEQPQWYDYLAGGVGSGITSLATLGLSGLFNSSGGSPGSGTGSGNGGSNGGAGGGTGGGGG